MSFKSLRNQAKNLVEIFKSCYSNIQNKHLELEEHNPQENYNSKNLFLIQLSFLLDFEYEVKNLLK